MSETKLTHQQTADLCRSLSELIHAGFSTADACHLLSSGEEGAVKDLLSRWSADTDTGMPLSEAFLLCNSFPSSTAELIRVGESTGYLEEALLSASQYHGFRHKTAQQLRSSLGYPFLLLGIMLVVTGVLLIQVLPVFDSVYASLGCSMTGVAAGLLHLGRLLKTMLPGIFIVMLLLAATALVCRFWKPAQRSLTRFCGKILDDRWLFRDFRNARFMYALSMGIRSGIVPEAAIALAASLMSDSPGAAARCESCLSLLRDGISFPEALLAEELLDPYGARMLSISSKTGNTDKIVSELANRMQEQAEQHLQDTLRSVEPVIVLVFSALVGLILLSVMLPLMQVLSALG